MAKKDLTYKDAIDELERIVGDIEGEGVDVDALTEKVKRASYLIGFCRTRLRETEGEVKKVLSEIEDKTSALNNSDNDADDDNTQGGAKKSDGLF